MTFRTAIPISLAPLRANIMEEQLAEGAFPERAQEEDELSDIPAGVSILTIAG